MQHNFTERLGRFWCRLMHESTMWPIDGHYQCATCLRQFPVEWNETPARKAALGTLNALAQLPHPIE